MRQSRINPAATGTKDRQSLYSNSLNSTRTASMGEGDFRHRADLKSGAVLMQRADSLSQPDSHAPVVFASSLHDISNAATLRSAAAKYAAACANTTDVQHLRSRFEDIPPGSEHYTQAVAILRSEEFHLVSDHWTVAEGSAANSAKPGNRKGTAAGMSHADSDLGLEDSLPVVEEPSKAEALTDTELLQLESRVQLQHDPWVTACTVERMTLAKRHRKLEAAKTQTAPEKIEAIASDGDVKCADCDMKPADHEPAVDKAADGDAVDGKAAEKPVTATDQESDEREAQGSGVGPIATGGELSLHADAVEPLNATNSKKRSRDALEKLLEQKWTNILRKRQKLYQATEAFRVLPAIGCLRRVSPIASGADQQGRQGSNGHTSGGSQNGKRKRVPEAYGAMYRSQVDAGPPPHAFASAMNYLSTRLLDQDFMSRVILELPDRINKKLNVRYSHEML